MNKQQMLDIFTQEQRINLITPGFRREETEEVVRHVSLSNEFGFILYSNASDERIDEVIQEELQYFKSLGQPFEWKYYDYDKPSNLKEKLKEHGFEVEDAEALLVLDLNNSQHLMEFEISPNIKPIVDDEGIDKLIELEDEVWGTSHKELGERLKRDLKDDPETLLIYGAFVNEKVVSTAWVYLHEGTSFGSLWGGSTLSEYRNRGFYTSLLAKRAKMALEKGYSLLTVDASPMSKPILQKKGFELLAYSYPCKSPSFK